MFDHPGFLLRQLIYESQQSLIYRVLWEDNSALSSQRVPMVLKLLKQDYPTPQQLNHYRQEYEITRSLTSAGVIRTYNIQPYQHRLFICFEDIGGQSLTDHLAQNPIPLGEVLTLAMAVTATLHDIHSAGIIHRDINPSNIIYNGKTGQVKIIDFGLATRWHVGLPSLDSQTTITGTLAYISPEQTGRLNCNLDSRTDLYSLGATLYHLLTRQLPFPTKDVLELLHCHIARIPPPPHHLDGRIPEPLSAIVMKLMAKSVNDRYQTARGLLRDLERCAADWQRDQTIAAFPLGERDRFDQFQLPATLFGRETAIATLEQAFDAVVRQTLPVALVTISGGAGVGKTALVQELYSPITLARGILVTGKCDQLQRTRPYDVIVQALQQLVRKLLTESETHLQQWRSHLQAALGQNGQVLIDLIPDLALILGPQPDVVPLGLAEAQHRFHRLVRQFLAVFCAPERPLVMFLDDLHWADSATLQLLTVLLNDPQQRSLLVIGAYRDHDLSPTHPLISTLSEFQEQGLLIDALSLDPLPTLAITDWIATTLAQDASHVAPLAAVIQTKTGGNPFFTREFLMTVVRQGAIAFDHDQQEWTWDLEAIASQASTTNVVELMIATIQTLPPPTQRALRYAACFGNTVDIRRLAQVLEQPLPKLQATLAPAITHTLLLPHTPAGIHPPSDHCRFRHDRIQQAAYELLATHERVKAHYKIARLLLKTLTPQELQREVFIVADHCNLGYPILSTTPIRQQGAELNLQAAQQAQASTAYAAALSYCQMGIKLLAPNRWLSQYDLTRHLYTHGAANAYSLGQYDTMQDYVQTLLLHSHHVLDQVPAYDIQIRAHITQGHLSEAIDTLLTVLRRLDIHYPRSPHRLQLCLALGLTVAQLRRYSTTALKTRPALANPRIAAALALITTALPALAITNHNLYHLLSLQQVRASLRHGYSPDSAVGYAHFAVWLGTGLRQPKLAQSLSQLAMTIVDRLAYPAVQGHLLWLDCAYLRHWHLPSVALINGLKTAYQTALDVGDLTAAAAALLTRYRHRYYLGLEELPPLAAELQQVIEYSRQTLTDSAIAHLRLDLASIETLTNAANRNEPTTLAHDTQLYDVLVPHATQLPSAKLRLPDQTGQFWYAFNKMVLCYWFDDLKTARLHAQRAEQYQQVVRGTIGQGLWCFYDALIALATLKAGMAPHLQSLWQRAQQHEAQLRQWAKTGPAVYGHRLALVQAERSRHLGNVAEAIEQYDRAITLATPQNYRSEIALIYERAARFYLSTHKPLIAKTYLQEARYTYQQWGAIAKVRHLDRTYPTLLTAYAPPPKHLPSTITSNHISSEIDLATVIKSSQALSSEIRLDRLLTRLMQTLLENTGAQRAYLLSEDKGQWRIEMEGQADPPSVQLLQHIAPDGRLPLSILVYVVRTLKSIVLDNASQAPHDPQSPFYQRHDPYLIHQKPRSILCAPLIHQGKLLNIIYLENNLATGAFSAARLELVQLLCSQAAISLENARLYAAQENYTYTLEQRVAERTTELAQVNAELQRLASSDGLTHLANRRHFDEYLDQMWQRSAQEEVMLSLILCDVDYFKQYNDCYGHQQGDDCLIEISRALERAVKRPADLVARYGGEEFAVILPDTPASGAITVARRIGEEVARLQIPHTMSDVSEWVSVSLGVVCWLPSSHEPPHGFLLAADRALYRAKHQGRNRWVMA
ncbi:diguanylate cyclase [Spirulina major CS-329]|uniref:diguanylate cyclase domain-containing protein n=1 Tax=Spirulina TaxID=1154 RepID=UPI00232DB401|nr:MULTISPECIES: diguanylate cyclase [Spirulina]MDB9494669.1 diguanylate cyclase [Spirulina subsalsa CS-330]MDB9501792.1 diguanylate cyclase [Spirulina major CS-329]